MIAYDRRSGFIDAIVPNLNYAHNYSQEFKDNLRGLELEGYPDDIFDYRVIDKELVKMTDEEIKERKVYGRILSNEERFENKMLSNLTPSHDEIKKAENTIDILELLSEVL